MAEAPNTRNWKAMELPDFVGRNYHIEVSGEVALAGTGTTAKLTKRQPQGFNPAILLLDLEINTTGGIQGHIVRWAKVAYQEKTDGSQYDEADILYEGKIIEQIKVEHPKTVAARRAAAGKKKPAKRKPAKKKAAKKPAKKPARKAAKKKPARKAAARRRRRK